MITPKVSVVVPTCRRPELLVRCLTALAEQDFGLHDYEVIVVDDGARFPGGSIAPTVSAFQHDLATLGRPGPEIRYLATKNTRGPAGARNLGWRAAHAPVIAFTDDDTIPQRAWLHEGWKMLVEGHDAVTGRVEIPLPAVPTDYERDAGGLNAAEFVTANCLVRREALLAVGGFDERFTLAWREDSDLQFSLLRAGFSIGHAPRAVVVHPLRPAAWGISVGQQRKVVFDALLYKKHPQLYRSRIRRRPPWNYYGAVLALLAAAGAVASGLLLLAGVAALIWLVLTAAFALRRLRGTSLRPSHVAEMLLTSIVIPPVSLFWRALGALRFRVPFA
ncbi:MAG: glycosyltransferase family 2 protein [Bradyrhizobium sp.]|nr:glycosyltransferase family 2 protein [Bradyrhizobium sp.]